MKTTPDLAQTATAISSRSPISRSLAARRQDGRGLMRALGSNTLTTTNLMETLYSRMITTRCSPIFGLRCNPMGIPPSAALRLAPVLRPASLRHECQIWAIHLQCCELGESGPQHGT